MSRETSVKEWLRKAESDRDTSKYLLAGEKYEWFLAKFNFESE